MTGAEIGTLVGALVGLLGGLTALAYAYAAHLKASNTAASLQDHLQNEHDMGAPSSTH